MATKQQEFLDSELPKHLQPGETVLLRGVAEDPVRWVFAVLTLGLLSFRRIFFYLVLTDRRLLVLRTKPKFYFAFTPYPGLRFSAGTQVTEARAMERDQLAALIMTPQKPIHMLLGWRSVTFLDKAGQKLFFFIKRGAFGFPKEQGELYSLLAAKAKDALGVEVSVAGKK